MNDQCDQLYFFLGIPLYEPPENKKIYPCPTILPNFYCRIYSCYPKQGVCKNTPQCLHICKITAIYKPLQKGDKIMSNAEQYVIRLFIILQLIRARLVFLSHLKASKFTRGLALLCYLTFLTWESAGSRCCLYDVAVFFGILFSDLISSKLLLKTCTLLSIYFHRKGQKNN